MNIDAFEEALYSEKYVQFSLDFFPIFQWLQMHTHFYGIKNIHINIFDLLWKLANVIWYG